MLGRAAGDLRLLGILAGLTVVAPFATDMYAPGLAEVAADLRAPSWAIQLSLTAFLLGVVLGQLVLGPLSDRFGRRPVLLFGAAGFAVLSALAAAAPNAGLFDVLRLGQGLCAAAGLVVARAVVTDLFDDYRSARMFGTLAAITAAGPLLAPLLGGVVLSVASWRIVFVVLSALGVLLAAGVARWLPESRPVPGGASTVAAFGEMLALGRRRRFAALIGTLSFGNAAFFAYIAGAPFVFATSFGFSPTLISLVFGVNAAGNMLGALLFGRLAVRVPVARAAWVALAVATGVTALLTAFAATHAAPASVVWPALLVALAAFGVFLPAVTTQAQNAGRSAPGGASALLGAGYFTLGAAVSPVLGAFGDAGPLALSAVMATCFTLAAASYRLASPRRPAD